MKKVKAGWKTLAIVSLALPVQLSSQMPELAKLIVRSVPKGAAITVNGQSTGQYTDAQFVVKPGSYSVSVSGSANCVPSNPPTQLNVGGAKTLVCNGGKWQ